MVYLAIKIMSPTHPFLPPTTQNTLNLQPEKHTLKDKLIKSHAFSQSEKKAQRSQFQKCSPNDCQPAKSINK